MDSAPFSEDTAALCAGILGHLTDIKNLLLRQSKKVLTTEEVCELYGVSKSYVNEAVNQGLLPRSKLGKRLVRYAKSDVEAWLLQSI
jgi:excisionase family DNA binding protein